MNRQDTGSQQGFALIKFFSEEEHFLNFKKGNSFFRTPHYYRLCKDRGRGDRNESCIGYWDKDIGDKIPRFTVDGVELYMSNVSNLLVYPPHEQTDSWLQSWCIVGPANEFELSLSLMLKEFGSYFVVMPAQHVASYAEALSEVSGEEVRYGALQYSDDPLKRSLTVKDSKLSYQKELRFYLGECRKDEKIDKTLTLPDVSKFLLDAGSLKFTSPTGEIRYCSLGSGEVVKA